MKRWIILAGIVALGIASVVVSERKKVDAPASPEALLYLIADSEHELTRMPVNFTRMSDAEEISAGNQMARFYAVGQEEQKPPENIIVEQYLSRVGSRLARNAHRRLPYQFHYFPEADFVNAFALPGGHVYIGAGLLSLMDSEDELAAVMAHELEHIDHYHCVERLQQEQALRKIPLGGLVAIPIEIFEAGYSKDQELEADREGVRLAVAADYSPTGAIRMFETFDRLFREYHDRAATPQEEMSQVAQQALEGYFRSHPLPSERIAQIQRMIASEAWPTHPERDLEVTWIFLTAKAQEALSAHRYSLAEQLASRSLHTHPEQARAWQLAAQAQFAQAKFSEASASYRKALETGFVKPETISSYALSLAAVDRHSAAAEFVRGTENVKSGKPRDLDVAAAGLMLLNGNPAAAQALETEFRQSNLVQAPEWLGELGWWHYLAADYPRSADLLSAAVQQRPQDIQLGIRLAWAQTEIRRYADALQMLDENAYQPQNQSERMLARAVVRWQSVQRDEALRDFEAALNNAPEWGNPKWVKALYSPLVAQTIQEMQLESEIRKKKSKVAASR